MPALRAAALARSASTALSSSSGALQFATSTHPSVELVQGYARKHPSIHPPPLKKNNPTSFLISCSYRNSHLRGGGLAAHLHNRTWVFQSRRIACQSYPMAAASEDTAAASTSAGGADELCFGPYKIRPSEQVFFESKLSCALVNLKPIVPGHVLVIPKQVVQRFTDLSSEQVADLWQTAQKVGARLEKYFHATSLTYAIQDGPQAGQTVPHVHIHVLPRKEGDFENNDEIYNEIDKGEKGLSDKLKVESERRPRSSEEMSKEASILRSLFT